MHRVQVLTSLLVVFLLAAICVCADNQVLTEPATLSLGAPSSPIGSIALTSVNDALMQPRSSPLMTKNTFAMGNNVVITKSNIIIRKEASGSDSDSAESPTATTRIPPLARAIEGVVARSTSENANASRDAVLDMLGMEPSSTSFDAIRSQVMALFQLRSDHSALRNRVAALLDAVNEISGSEEFSYTGKDDGDDNGDDKDNDSDGKDGAEDDADANSKQQQLIGYRTLFRWSAGARTYYGWRYPLRYWVLYGSSRFGSTCGLGRVLGGYFYC